MVKCYDVVSMVVNEASNQFGKLWKVDNQKRDVLKQNCAAIDALSDEFGGVAFEVDVNDVTLDITVSLICPDIVISDMNHIIYGIIAQTNKFEIRKAEDNDSIEIDFTFPGIWENTI